VISLRSIFAFPLLARELTERAARKRTYAARVVYGLALYVIFVFVLRRIIGNAGGDPTGFNVLGLGRQLFQQLVEFQCWGVLLFQPALMAGVLTYEKERDSLSLLLLTRMSPTKMLLEKYLAGLLPMLTLLLLALPLGAITMGYGGVSPQLLACGAMIVLATWLQTGAFALLCSAWCRTTTGAMLAAYFGSALIHIAPALTYSLSVRYVLWGADLRGLEVPEWLWSLWPPETFARVLAFQEVVASSGEMDASALWVRLLGEAGRRCMPLLITAGVCLLLARLVMLQRAFTVSGGGQFRLFGAARLVPAVFKKWLHALWPKHTDLPENDPVAWREGMRSVLGARGRFWYFIAVAAGLTFALCLFLLSLYPRTAGPERLHHLAVVLAAAGVVILTVQSNGTLLAEHSNQTLQILLTTPLGTAEILRQKARALCRYWMLFAAMLAVVFAFEGWSEYQYVSAGTKWAALSRYWIGYALVLAVYPPLIVWTSLLLALSLQVRPRAIIAALIFFAIWIAGPRLILSLIWGGWQDTEPRLWLSLLSPLGIVEANEAGRFDDASVHFHGSDRSLLYTSGPWTFIVSNFFGYGLLLLGVRWLCLRMAERWLRRAG
jgi:hypothetical protein